MIKTINIREIILEILMEITEEEEYSHIVIRSVLEKYQFLEKRDRAFISRVCAGTVENMILLDYIIEQFSKVKVENMKPIIRNLLRMSVYQLRFMDTIPDSAVCNEAVKIAQKRGFYNLKGFVNGVLRNIARGMETIAYPSPQRDPNLYLSVTYSMPEWIITKWTAQFGFETVEKICQSFQKERMTSIRCNLDKASKEEVISSLKEQGIAVKKVRT